MGVFFVAMLFQSVAAADFEDLGQNHIREQWREIQSSTQRENFIRTHHMADLAEDAWAQVIKGETEFLSHPSADVFVAQYQAQALLRSKPLDFANWISATVHLGSQMIERPWDGLLVIKNLIDQWSIPLGVALFLVLCLHLWLWQQVIIATTPRWLLMRSKLSICVGLATLIVSCWLSSSLLWGLHLLICLTIIFSRRPILVIFAGAATALLLSIAPFSDIFIETQQMGSLDEALRLGRTRIEYSPSALQNLTPIQRAIWSAHNQDVQATNHWLEAAPVGLEKSALELQMNSAELSVTELTRGFEKLAEAYPSSPIVQYNLIQLYTRGQELVKADRLRNQMNPALYRALSEWSVQSNQFILGPQNDPLKSPLTEFFLRRLTAKVKSLGLIPFEWPRGLLNLIAFLLPWFLGMAAILHRRKASGLCVHTGDTTPSPVHEVSALYQSAMQRREPSAQAFRAQIEQSSRAYARLKSRRARVWGFLIGGSYDLVYDDALCRPFLFSAFLYAMIWFSLPLSIRYFGAHTLGAFLEPNFGPTQIFKMLALFTFIYWLILQWDRHRKAHR